MNAVTDRLKSAASIAILTHQRADPDALGSACGLALMLRKLNKTVRVLPFEQASPQYAFILLLAQAAGVNVTIWNSQSASEIEAHCDLIAVVDTCSYNQLEPAADLLKRLKSRVVAVDHHLTHDDIGTVYADTSAAACAEILWPFAEALGVAPAEPIATVLLAGLVADTGFFRFDSVTGKTLRAAAEMTDAGAKVADMFERITQTEQPGKLALVARALQSIQWAASSKIAVMTLLQSDFALAGAVVGQTEGIVNCALDVATVEVAALLTQMPDGKIRASLRSKHSVDVNAVARLFGGGGHAKASGLRLDGPLEPAREKILAALIKAVNP